MSRSWPAVGVLVVVLVVGACTGETEPRAAPGEVTGPESPSPSPDEASPSPEAERECLTAPGIRRMLLSRSNPDIWATRFNAAEAKAQGICCGPGYVVEAFSEFGEHVVIGPTRFLGKYRMFEPEPGEDVTFTQPQWIRYSRFEARRCRIDQ